MRGIPNTGGSLAVGRRLDVAGKTGRLDRSLAGAMWETPLTDFEQRTQSCENLVTTIVRTYWEKLLQKRFKKKKKINCDWKHL